MSEKTETHNSATESNDKTSGAERSRATENDLAILFPERELVLRGETVTVREFSFEESLRAGAIAQPILAELGQLIETTGTESTYPDLEELFARHARAYIELIALATGKPVEWIATLPGKEGDQLAMAFWVVNSGFFTRRLQMRAMSLRTAATASASANSSAH